MDSEKSQRKKDYALNRIINLNGQFPSAKIKLHSKANDTCSDRMVSLYDMWRRLVEIRLAI